MRLGTKCPSMTSTWINPPRLFKIDDGLAMLRNPQGENGRAIIMGRCIGEPPCFGHCSSTRLNVKVARRRTWSIHSGMSAARIERLAKLVAYLRATRTPRPFSEIRQRVHDAYAGSSASGERAFERDKPEPLEGRIPSSMSRRPMKSAPVTLMSPGGSH